MTLDLLPIEHRLNQADRSIKLLEAHNLPEYAQAVDRVRQDIKKAMYALYEDLDVTFAEMTYNEIRDGIEVLSIQVSKAQKQCKQIP